MMPKPRLLLVEDEMLVAADMEERLEYLGYTVVDLAASGEDALSLAATTQPDLVLMDIMLQGSMDGIAAATQLRAALQVPVVFLTAYADDTLVRRAQQAEPYGYLLKPFEERLLKITIDMALAKHHMEQERARLLAGLQTALSQVRTLQGLLPMCASCKSIRNDQGYWTEVEKYLSHHMPVTFTHGICPPCIQKLYPDIAAKLERRKP